jgi:hypothetical protein
MVSICGDVFRVKGNGEDCEDFRPSKKNTGGRRPPALTPKLLAVSDRLLRFRARGDAWHGGKTAGQAKTTAAASSLHPSSFIPHPSRFRQGHRPLLGGRKRGRRRAKTPAAASSLHPSSFIPHPSRFRQGHRPLLGGRKRGRRRAKTPAAASPLHPSSFIPHPSRFRQGRRPLLGGLGLHPASLILVSGGEWRCAGPSGAAGQRGKGSRP